MVTGGSPCNIWIQWRGNSSSFCPEGDEFSPRTHFRIASPITDPWVGQVVLSAGFSLADARNWIRTVQRHSRYDRACQDLHPGLSCTGATMRAIPAIVKMALRDVAFFWLLLAVRAALTGAKRPPLRPLGTTLTFCIAASIAAGLAGVFKAEINMLSTNLRTTLSNTTDFYHDPRIKLHSMCGE